MSIRFRLGVLLVGLVWGCYVGLPEETYGGWVFMLALSALPFVALAWTAPLFGRVGIAIVCVLMTLLNVEMLEQVKASKSSTAAVALAMAPLGMTAAVLTAAVLAWFIGTMRRTRWR